MALSFDEILKKGLDKIKGYYNNPAIIQLLDSITSPQSLLLTFK
jgi:hypothetical protein